MAVKGTKQTLDHIRKRKEAVAKTRAAWTDEQRDSFALREEIRNRDGRKCCICGLGENGKRHDVHHIDYDKKNLNPLNLLTLCVPCHRKTYYRREYWKAVLRNTVNSTEIKAVNIG